MPGRGNPRFITADQWSMWRQQPVLWTRYVLPPSWHVLRHGRVPQWKGMLSHRKCKKKVTFCNNLSLSKFHFPHCSTNIVVTYLTICLRNTFYSLFVGSLLRWWALLLLPRLQVYRRWSLCRDKTCGSQHDLNRWRTLNSWHTAFTLKNPVIPYLTSISFIPR